MLENKWTTQILKPDFFYCKSINIYSTDSKYTKEEEVKRKGVFVSARSWVVKWPNVSWVINPWPDYIGCCLIKQFSISVLGLSCPCSASMVIGVDDVNQLPAAGCINYIRSACISNLHVCLSSDELTCWYDLGSGRGSMSAWPSSVIEQESRGLSCLPYFQGQDYSDQGPSVWINSDEIGTSLLN